VSIERGGRGRGEERGEELMSGTWLIGVCACVSCDAMCVACEGERIEKSERQEGKSKSDIDDGRRQGKEHDATRSVGVGLDLHGTKRLTRTESKK
jgi:hypothetical protein